MINQSFEILAISDHYFAKYIEAEAMLMEKIASMTVEMANGMPDEEESRLLQMYDNVGIVSIKGMLTNRDSYWNRYFGMVSYNEIREAVVQSANKGAKAVLYDFDTPGGSVSGLKDTASLIANVGLKSVSFTSGSMASAGYFLGSQADYLYADSFAEVGSIGVVVKLYDRSKMLKDLGVKPMRFRSGDLKAAGDGDFALTDKEKSYIQQKVDLFAGKFYDIVSQARGIPVQYMDKVGITSGRTYIGEEAMAVNLVDKIQTFDQALAKAVDLSKKVDKKNNNGLFS